MKNEKRRLVSFEVRTILILATFFSFVAVLENKALAGPKVTFKPMLSAAGKYDSNFYGTDKDEQEVYTLLVQPGLSLGTVWDKTRADFSYAAEWHKYWGDDKETQEQGNTIEADSLDYIGHLFSLGIRTQATDRMTVGLDDGFYVTRYPYYYDRLSTAVDNRKYWTNRLSPYVFYEFNYRLTAGLRYKWQKVKYDDEDDVLGTAGDFFGDSDEHRWTLTLAYNPTRTTTLDLDYSFWELNYDDEQYADDYTGNHVMITGQKRYRYLSVDVGIGFNNQSYEGSDQEDQTTVTYKVGLTTQSPPPPERRRDMGKLYLRPLDHLYVGAVRNANTYGDYYTADRFVLSLGKVFFDRINCQVRAWYQIGDYKNFEGTTGEDSEKREDKTSDVSFLAGYMFSDMLGLNFTIGRTERNSNLEGYDYVNNYMILSLDFNFDAGARAGFLKEALYYW